MSDIIKKQLEAYQSNFLKHGNTPEGTFQNNNTTQYERFNQLLTPLLRLKSSDFSICDIGSGVCDLHKYLKLNGINHQYTGVEIVPEMIETAQKMYPEIKLLNTDIVGDNFNEKFDFTVLSGTFNIPGSVGENDWEEFIFSVIKKMYQSAEIGISFNALTTYSTFTVNDLFYLKPEKVFSYIQSELSRFCIVNTAYPLFEVTYTILKPEFLHSKYPHSDFTKYFKNKQ
jgi:hypothetical protein